jgi:hypothetical protein
MQRTTTILLWLLTLTYLSTLLLAPSNLIPGEPAWAIQPHTWQEVIKESTNFFFILPIANALGIHWMWAPIVHPVTQALFNFAEAWIFMFLPLLLLEQRGPAFPRWLLWSLALFFTNILLAPFMALRSGNPTPQVPEAEKIGKNRGLSRLFGAIGLVVGTISIGWFGFGSPEFGGFPERIDYFGRQITSDRLFLAFCADLTLFALFQAILLRAIEPDQRKRWLGLIPFGGLGIWLFL